MQAQAVTLTQIDEGPLLQKSVAPTEGPATTVQAPSPPSSVDLPPLTTEEDLETALQQQDTERSFDGQSHLEATVPTANLPNFPSSKKANAQSTKGNSRGSAKDPTASQGMVGRDDVGSATAVRANSTRPLSRPSIQSVGPSQQMVSPDRVQTRGSSAKRPQVDSRESEAGPSARRIPTSLRPEDQYQTVRDRSESPSMQSLTPVIAHRKPISQVKKPGTSTAAIATDKAAGKKSICHQHSARTCQRYQ